MARRKARSRGGIPGKIVRFLLKCIFVYPFKGLWFLLKQIYYIIHDLVTKKKETREELQKPAKAQASSVKQSSAAKAQPVTSHLQPQHVVRAGSLRHNPTPTPLHEVRNFEGDF